MLLNHRLNQCLSLRPRFRAIASPLFVMGLGLSLVVSACAPSEPVATESNATETALAEAAPTTAAPTEATESKTFTEAGVAIKGADPVAYFTDEAFVAGSTDYTHEWRGATWQFSTAENLDLFVANPEQYAPQYGGYCAWAVGQNALAAIDPTAWSIVDGKLYLNANKRIQDRWNKDIPGNIALAESNWPSLSQQ
ncbi:MAG: YHS domain-containing (seleno)protein [Cyanobacteria bacterium J06621_11]